MFGKVVCPFCQFYGEPEAKKISKKKPVFELTCSRCGNVIRENQYIAKPKTEKRCNYER